MAQRDKRIAIVGAGLAGALLASLLAELGYRVSVFERRPDPRRRGFIGGRSINLALSLRGIHALERAGLDGRVLADAIPMRGRMIHSPTGHLTSQPYSKNRSDAINSVSRGGLNLTLLQGAAARNVEYHFEHRCVGVDLDAPTITVTVGDSPREKTFETDLVIGCDGAFSAVRAPMQLLDRFSYSQHYLEHGYKELTIPPTGAGDFAMEPHALHIWPRGGYMMIALPNPDRSFTCTCFWPFTGANSFAAVRGADQVRSFFGSHFPDAARLMPTLVEDFERNPTSSLVTVRCGPWHHDGKVLLLGDAAHAIVPFYGQGMNAAFEDCALLADCIREHGDDADALARFYSDRKPDADAIADLALDNFHEMRDHIASPGFRLKKRTERVLHRLLPWCYTPLYNMVSFTRIPYAQARRRARRTRRLLQVIAGAMLALAALAALLWRLL